MRSPDAGEDWWFVVVCPPGTADCGRGESYGVVTAPIWLAAATSTPATPAAPTATGAAVTPVPAASAGHATIPTTGGQQGWLPWALLALALVGYRAAVSMSSDIWKVSASTPRARPWLGFGGNARSGSASSATVGPTSAASGARASRSKS